MVPSNLLAQCQMSAADGGSPAILLAEDNQDDAYLFLRSFRKTAPLAKVSWFEAGDFLLGYLDALPEGREPSLVVLDLKMPRMDGFEVLQQLRSNPRFQHIPAVIFSSSDHPAEQAKAEKLGASGYYRKPLAFREYEQTLSAMAALWLPQHLR